MSRRKKEVTALTKFITKRLDAVEKTTALIRKKIPKVLKQQKQRLLDRYNELKIELEPSRIEQE